jgi:hypothetical protein
MGCSLCGVSTTGEPCAIICYSDCSVCWVDAPGMLARMVVDLNSDAATGKHEFKLTGATKVKVCLSGATQKQVADLLNKVLVERLSYEGAGTGALNETHTGTLDEVLKKIGLKVSAAKAR